MTCIHTYLVYLSSLPFVLVFPKTVRLSLSKSVLCDADRLLQKTLLGSSHYRSFKVEKHTIMMSIRSTHIVRKLIISCHPSPILSL